MSDLILSFCIGTYNQAERVFALVKSILSCDRDDIEVVVTDNDSTDNTIELLSTISDPRFHVFKNEKNIGAVANWTRSVTHARGKYAFFCMDRDYVVVENISKLCDFLYAHELTFVYCNNKINRDIIYKDKYESFLNLYMQYHPTGVIYNVACLQKIEDLGWFEKEKNVGYYPQNYLAGRLCLMGDSAQIRKNYWKLSERKFVPQSFAYGRPIEDLFFHPKSRLDFLFKTGSYLIELNYFNNKDIKRILHNKYVYYSLIAIVGFRNYMRDPKTVKHYGIELKKYSNIELYKIYLDFYNNYKKSDLFSYYSFPYKCRFFIFNIWMFIRLYLYDSYRLLIKK